jgi:twitching motility protein PilT
MAAQPDPGLPPSGPGASFPARATVIGLPVPIDAALRDIIVTARQRNASDLLLCARQHPRTREGDALIEMPGRASIPGRQIDEWVAAVCEPHHRARLDLDGHVDLALEAVGAGRMRVNISRHQGGHKLSIRLVEVAPRPLASLGLPGGAEEALHRRTGLVLVTGPRGHGKTTTLASLIDAINASRPVHIATVERAIEFLHAPARAVIAQRELYRHVPSWAAGFRSMLAEDPDVIVVSELWDAETIRSAVGAAESGKLVLATVDAPDPGTAIRGLIEAFPAGRQAAAREAIADVLTLVLAQVLVPAIEPGQRQLAIEVVPEDLEVGRLIRDDRLDELAALLARAPVGGAIVPRSVALEALAQAGRIHLDTARKWSTTAASKNPAGALDMPEWAS